MSMIRNFLFLEIELVPLWVPWILMSLLGAVGLVLSVIRWWLGIPTLLLLIAFSLMFSIELYEDLYPAIVRQDPYYIWLLNIAISFGFLLNLAGIVINIARRLFQIR